MTDYRYVFDHKGKKSSCPSCGHRGRFRRFIDTTTGELMGEEFGMCDRRESCGYYFVPSGLPDDKPRKRMIAPAPKNTSWRCPQEVIDGCQRHEYNTFAHWMVGLLGDRARDALRAYKVGTYPPGERHPELTGAAIFWQIGSDQKHRSGKIMVYGTDGRRVKEHGAKWIHSVLWGKSMDELGIGQCLFGAHLIHGRPDAEVCVVESEKTAIIASCFHPDKVWVATGGSNRLTVESCMDLVGRKVWVFPDAGWHQDWSSHAVDIEIMCEWLRVSDTLEAIGAEAGSDLADFMVVQHPDVPLTSYNYFEVNGVNLFPEPVPKDVKRQQIDAWNQVVAQSMSEMSEGLPVVKIESPVDRISALPGIQSLIRELDLDMTRATIHPNNEDLPHTVHDHQ